MPTYNPLIQSLDKPTFPMCIYALLDPNTNNIRYIGITIRGFKRIAEHYHHCGKINKKTGFYSPVKLWVQKLKKENKIFKVKYLEYFIENNNLIDLREQFYIQQYKDLNLLNLQLGGRPEQSGLSLETRKVISKRTKEALNTPEMKDFFRQNIAKQRKLGQMVSVKWSKEHKERISKQQEYWVHYIKDEQGNIYRGIKAAAKAIGCSPSGVAHVIYGRCKTVHGKRLFLVEK